MKPNPYFKSVLEEISQPVFKAKTLDEGKQIIIKCMNEKKINDDDKKTIIKNVNECKTLIKLQTYICNSILQFEQLGVNQLNKSARAAAAESLKNHD